MMDLLSRPFPAADHRIAYGEDASQFGDLWLPAGGGRAPVVAFFHGGWWKSEYGLGYAGHLCAALRDAGMAVWSVEYRRVGTTGGGWPATFQDAGAGFDAISTLSERYPLDVSRTIAVGHSAGGHLAFLMAGRHHLADGGAIERPRREIPLRGVVALAGAVDLRLTIELAGDSLFAHDREEVYRLMGGGPDEVPERYAAGNPGDLLPLRVPQILLQGNDDDQIPPELPHRWAAMAGEGRADVLVLPGADHFDVVDPEAKAWPVVMGQIRRAIGMSGEDGRADELSPLLL